MPALTQAVFNFLGITTLKEQLIWRKGWIFLKFSMAAGQTVPETSMNFPRIFPMLACAALLGACAGPAPAPADKSTSMASILADADASAKSGRPDQAYAMLKTAAVSHPADKTPLLRIAQMHFDDKNYGEAIVNGLKALERDPDDMLAYSLVAVSGLRVSSKALGDLAQKNGFTGSVRSEAQDLATLLRKTLNESIVSTPPARVIGPRPATPVAPPVKSPAAAATVKPPCSNPFCGLN